YTLPFVDRLFVNGPDIAVIRLVHREQGLMVAPGNPLGISGIDDLTSPGLRYVNRQRGAGTRALLDAELSARGIDSGAIEGYAREEYTHLAVAAAVAAGRADVGMGIRAAARAFGLDLVPVAEEPYDLVLRTETVEDPLLAPLWALLADPKFRADVEALGGYSCAQTGRRIR
ncbi:MAG TPA: substrate-binding domain-containing protein, partial [Sporichthya sp.]|nr:substrate-binding domain-containing protein [Sporichthya sp.]